MLQKLISEVELAGRHLEVIRAVLNNQPIGILKLSEIMQIPSHRVRYSLRILEQSGYIQASQSGAVATEKAEELIKNLDKEIDALISMLTAIKEDNSAEKDQIRNL